MCIFSNIEWMFGECAVLENHPKIFMKKPLMLFKILRNFGHLMKILGVNFCELNAKISAEIEKNYLAKYCSDSLQRLYLVCAENKITFEHLQEPLKNVTTLGIVQLGTTSRTIYLNDSQLPNLRNMIYKNLCATVHKRDHIHYKNIEYFSLSTAKTMENFPFSFENLKHFCVYGNIKVTDAFCELIDNIKHLKTFKLLCVQKLEWDAFSKIFQIQNILSNVVEMDIEFHKALSFELILQFLKNSQNLKKIGFSSCVSMPQKREFDLYSNVMQIVSSNLENEWSSYIITSQKTLTYPHQELKCYVLKRILAQ